VIDLVLLTAALAAGQADPVVLRLERLTNCGGWKVAIHQSGRSTGELFNACHPVRPKKVSVQRLLPEEVPRLRELVERERFSDLAARPHEANPAVDDAACVIGVSFERLEHEVTISGKQLSGKDTDLAPFRVIWRTVQSLIPEPEW
jgi:hypothetical protein